MLRKEPIESLDGESFEGVSETRLTTATKSIPTCLPQFGGGSIESPDGESFEGVGW
jgi:hypothetical protein